MGQKINPRSMRLQVDHDWQSRWYADRDYATFNLFNYRPQDAPCYFGQAEQACWRCPRRH